MMALSWPGPCYGSWLQVITSAWAIMECNKREQIAAHPGSPGSPGHGQSGGDTPLILLKILYPILYPPPPGLCKLYRRPPLKIQSREDIPPAVARGWRRGLLVIPRPRRPHLQLSRRCHSGLLIYGVPHSGEPANIALLHSNIADHVRYCDVSQPQ